MRSASRTLSETGGTTMPMNRQNKEITVQGMSDRLRRAPLVVLADYRGTTVADITSFRSQLQKAGLHYQVVKNTLAKRALAGTPMEKLQGSLKGMTGWVFSGEDAIASAKLLRDVSKSYKTLEIKGGFFDGTVLDAEGVKKVADLPSKEELRSQLLATILEAPTKFVRVLQAPSRDLLYLLQNYATKLESPGA
jgi:large subunit ribosomal protein L10